MRLFIALALASLLLFGCTGNSGNSGYSAPDNGLAAAGGSPGTAGNAVDINITAKDWSFDPGTITVHKGDTVRLHITSIDVEHGFSLPDYGINVQISPGKTTDVAFVADKSGSFGFRCSVICGQGHRQMTGTLVVQ
jgi:cytochrome c oxidase subunit II